MRMLARGLTAGVTLVASMAALPAATAQVTHTTALPLRSTLAPLHESSQAVPGQYIVTLDNGVDPTSFAKKFGVSPMFHYSKVFSGFASTFSAAQLNTVRRTAGVAAVEQNATVTADGLGATTDAPPADPDGQATDGPSTTTDAPNADNDGQATDGPSATTDSPSTTTDTPNADNDAQATDSPSTTTDVPGATTDAPNADRDARAAAASWGLDRIDQRNLPLDHQFTVAGTGQGATAYVLDTGIDYGHSEFGGRAVPGYDAIGDGRNGQDCEGHGTHVAGTIGGATYGVARQATLVSVRVLDCQGSGTLAGVIAGMDWIAQNAQQPAVANASLGGAYSPALNDAVDALSDSGVLPVVAAGNDGADACNDSPASAPRVMAIGASDASDNEASFSNSGSCVSMFAPGTAIVSAKLGGGSVTMDGTSMASPHAAGSALLYKSEHPDADAMAVADALTASATQNVLHVNGGSPNLLLYTGGL